MRNLLANLWTLVVVLTLFVGGAALMSLGGCMQLSGNYDPKSGVVTFQVSRLLTDTAVDGVVISKTADEVRIEVAGYKSSPETRVIESLINKIPGGANAVNPSR